MTVRVRVREETIPPVMKSGCRRKAPMSEMKATEGFVWPG